jgi:hypothetical protein
MMTAQTESLSTQGVRSLEMRWIIRGGLAAAVAGSFTRFPAETTALQDAYLLDPHLPGLSVKVREGRALEVKVYRGSPGLLEVAGRARGRLESWQKWSFPHGLASWGRGDAAGWMLVTKRRRVSWFPGPGGPARPRARGLDEGPGCAVELTEVDADGGTWWTLGFEATGPPDALRSQLEAVAAFVFAHALPAGLNLGLNESRSYAQWLRRAAGAPGLEAEALAATCSLTREMGHLRT